VTLKNGAAMPPIGGTVLSQRSQPRQWQALVRGLAEIQIMAIRGHAEVEDVDVHAASLEDIFVAYMQGNNGAENGSRPSILDPRQAQQEAAQP
jgi:hypothetical protein